MPGDKGPHLRWITSRSEMRSVRKNGNLTRGNLVFVWECETGTSGTAETAVAVVTGRGFANAVSRNRAKRRLRGCVYDLRDLLEPGVSYRIEGRTEQAEADYQLLVTEMRGILSRTRNCAKKKPPQSGRK